MCNYFTGSAKISINKLKYRKTKGFQSRELKDHSVVFSIKPALKPKPEFLVMSLQKGLNKVGLLQCDNH